MEVFSCSIMLSIDRYVYISIYDYMPARVRACVYYRGDQLDEPRKPHFRKQLRQEPCSSKKNICLICCLLISVHAPTMCRFQVITILLCLYNLLKRSLGSASCAWERREGFNVILTSFISVQWDIIHFIKPTTCAHKYIYIREPR